MNNFLDVAYEQLLNAFMDDAGNYVGKMKMLTSVRNGCFLSVLILFYSVAIIKFIETLKDEIWKTKGLLNFIPTKFLIKNSELKNKSIFA